LATASKLRLSSVSGVVCLPGSAETIRGFSAPALVIEDEAAFVGDALHVAVRPMLAVSDGRLILMSTPNGMQGHFFEAWSKGGADWARTEVPADHCPRISKEFLEQERRTLGDLWFRQEYLCEFLATLDQVFSYEDVQAAFDDEVKPLFA
jgi:hypothetical protein